jgi:hypothetical protein
MTFREYRQPSCIACEASEVFTTGFWLLWLQQRVGLCSPRIKRKLGSERLMSLSGAVGRALGPQRLLAGLAQCLRGCSGHAIAGATRRAGL